mgnify:CR=1 FL=1
MHIAPRHLVLLVRIADHGSLTHAAQSLNLTQSALSQSLKQIEETIGAKLVERNRQGAKLTEIGERIVRYGRVIDQMVARTREDIQDWEAGKLGRLAIGVTPLPARIVPMAIGTFLKERPKLAVTLFEDSLPSLIAGIEKGNIDVAVGYIGMAQPPDGLEAHRLYDDHLCIMAGRDHPLAQKDKITHADLEGANWLEHYIGTAIQSQTRTILALNGFTQIKTQIELGSATSLMSILASNHYIALMPKALLELSDMSEGLIALDYPLEGTRWPMGYIYRPEHVMPNLIWDFAEMLRDNFSDRQKADASS